MQKLAKRSVFSVAALAALFAFAETRVVPTNAEKEPKLLFHATFDGSAQAMTADGVRQPRAARGLSFAPGRLGEAVRMTAAAKSTLAYEAAGALDQMQGTVAVWAKTEWPKDGPGNGFRFLFAHTRPRVRLGSGSLSFWYHGLVLRGDVSDDRDSFVTAMPQSAFDGAWHHYAFTWDANEMRLYVDGRSLGRRRDGTSPLVEALRGGGKGFEFSSRQTFDRFFVGGRDGASAIDGCLDDLRIYSAPLSRRRSARSRR